MCKGFLLKGKNKQKNKYALRELRKADYKEYPRSKERRDYRIYNIFVVL